jgi:aminomuconate-semialdehyde/2-hydroxymuconate-6-semialdehyde dehydrogenase
MKIVLTIQSAKQAQETYKKKDLGQRAEILEKLATSIFRNRQRLVEELSLGENLPPNFVSSELVEALQKKIENLRIEVQIFSQPQKLLPTGLVAARFDSTFFWSEVVLFAANTVAAGNSAIILVPESSSRAAELVRLVLSEAGAPENLITLLEDPTGENARLLSAHPGVRALLIKGEEESGEILAKTAFAKKKKVQFFLGTKNSSLIHPEFDFENQMLEIVNPFLIGAGQLPVNCHRLFISQSVENRFYEVLIETTQNKFPDIQLRSEKNKIVWEQSVSQVTTDSGKILIGGKALDSLRVQPTWTRDLSNCSVMQQQWIPAPFFIITAVKYTHEMIKWTNTGEYGHSAVVWGPEEKVLALSQGLNVGHVHLNKWTGFFDMGLPVKGSFLGIPNSSWSGDFHSDVKKLA